MAQTDHDRLIRIDENVNMILSRLEKYDLEMDKMQERMGGMEKFQAKLVGIAGAVSFVVSVIWTQLGRIFGSV